jgi:hypothetical protein
MATTITAGNSTNGGAAISSDNTGILELKTGSGSGTTALTLSTAQAATFAGAITSSGLVTGATGALYPIVSGTVNAGGTNPFPSSSGPATVDFTGIPSWAKRVTVMFSGVGTNGTSNLLVQIGSGSVKITDYLSGVFSSNAINTGSTAGFILTADNELTNIHSGHCVITLLSGNVYAQSGVLGNSTTPSASGGISVCGGNVTLSGALDRVRITTVNGTDLFDAGSINIMWE